eukprot:TRINITY_DN23898_c0_g1_i1.p1 TRINITY_DN23898_c0_g1~~TRINITY_DN23898_c0_g1_i1.p1  ORF type:complete len:232 (+),score=40.10 TRINITY_DN23898_c0_g1_i1:3-698(+)
MRSGKCVYLVKEYVDGGDLFDRLVAAKRFDEPVARNYFQQLVTAVHYCHQKGVAHRDLKPDNILLTSTDVLKLTGFGSARLQQLGTADSHLLQCFDGTPSYVSPEVLKDTVINYFAADVWACGVIFYTMLAGYLPFDDPHVVGLFRKIEKSEYNMPKHFTAEQKSLVSKMLIIEVEKRATIDDIITDPWFSQGFDESRLTINTPTREPPCTITITDVWEEDIDVKSPTTVP